MKRLDLTLAFVGGAATTPGKSLLGALYQMLLPRLCLVRVRLETLSEFGQRAVAAYGGEGYFRLERSAMGSACSAWREISSG